MNERMSELDPKAMQCLRVTDIPFVFSEPSGPRTLDLPVSAPALTAAALCPHSQTR